MFFYPDNVEVMKKSILFPIAANSHEKLYKRNDISQYLSNLSEYIQSHSEAKNRFLLDPSTVNIKKVIYKLNNEQIVKNFEKALDVTYKDRNVPPDTFKSRVDEIKKKLGIILKPGNEILNGNEDEIKRHFKEFYNKVKEYLPPEDKTIKYLGGPKAQPVAPSSVSEPPKRPFTKDPQASSSKPSTTQRTAVPLRSSSPTPTPSSSASRPVYISKFADDSEKVSKLYNQSVVDATPLATKDFDTIKRFFQINHGENMEESVNPDYVDYLNIWKPYETFNAICFMYEQKKKELGEKKLWSIRVVHLLHHFRVCLEILHLLYFRKAATTKDSELTKYTYISVFNDLNKMDIKNKVAPSYKEFERNKPLVIYAGWDMTKLNNHDNNIAGNTKFLHLKENRSVRELYTKYDVYYQSINDAFKKKDLINNEIDTCIEVLCLLFSVNYKLYIHGDITNRADRYNPSNIPNNIISTLNSLRFGNKSDSVKSGKGYVNSYFWKPPHECFIPNTSNDELCVLYEKHCILIVYTLLLLGVDNFHVLTPPNVGLIDSDKEHLK
jgi:hypothetical protein